MSGLMSKWINFDLSERKSDARVSV